MPKAIITYRWERYDDQHFCGYIMSLCGIWIASVEGSLGNYVVLTHKYIGNPRQIPLGETFPTLKEAKTYAEKWHGFYKLPMPDINSQPRGEYC